MYLITFCCSLSIPRRRLGKAPNKQVDRMTPRTVPIFFSGIHANMRKALMTYNYDIIIP
jgi:hypothetical protein